MKRNIIISIVLILVLAACGKEVYEKPKKLIREKKMITMLVDIHLANATYINQMYYGTADTRKFTDADLYHSVLHKYNVPDSVFERSYIYYASKPKVFEKMYRKVTNRLTEIEHEAITRRNELLELENSNQ